MSYCSKIYIIDRYGDFGRVLATYDSDTLFTNYMSYSDLFTKEIDFRSYMDDDNTEIKYDKYNSVCRYCDIDKFIKWLKDTIKFEKSLGNKEKALKPMYKFLKALKKCYTRSDFVILHYGY